MHRLDLGGIQAHMDQITAAAPQGNSQEAGNSNTRERDQGPRKKDPPNSSRVAVKLEASIYIFSYIFYKLKANSAAAATYKSSRPNTRY